MFVDRDDDGDGVDTDLAASEDPLPPTTNDSNKSSFDFGVLVLAIWPATASLPVLAQHQMPSV